MKDYISMGIAILGGIFIAAGIGIIEHSYGTLMAELFFLASIVVYFLIFFQVIKLADKKSYK